MKKLIIFIIMFLFVVGCTKKSNDNTTISISKTINTDEILEEKYDGIYDTKEDLDSIESITVDNGVIEDFSIDGTVIKFIIINGEKNIVDENVKKTENPDLKASSYKSSCKRYTCPEGGTVSGSRCVSDDIIKTYNLTYSCTTDIITNGWKWNLTGGILMGNLCADRYTYKEGTCDTKPLGACDATVEQKKVECNYSCIWGGDYNATCMDKEYIDSCPEGYTILDDVYCYKCNNGKLVDNVCQYEEHKNYTYYKYAVTINYKIKNTSNNSEFSFSIDEKMKFYGLIGLGGIGIIGIIIVVIHKIRSKKIDKFLDDL